jgi:hypothetical protein
MTKFVVKALLRAGSIFFPILLLKLALDSYPTDASVAVKFVYGLVVCFGIPLIFFLINVIANLISYDNKR